MNLTGASLSNFGEPLFTLWNDLGWHWASNNYFRTAPTATGDPRRQIQDETFRSVYVDAGIHLAQRRSGRDYRGQGEMGKIVVLILTAMILAPGARAANFYVASDGNDANSVS